MIRLEVIKSIPTKLKKKYSQQSKVWDGMFYANTKRIIVN